MVAKLVLLSLASLSGAVNIQLFPLTLDCTDVVTVTCTNIAPLQCCSGNGNAQSARFTYLRTSGVPDQGITYPAQYTGNPCGTSCNAGYGDPLCLDCGNQGIGGANWVNPSGMKRTTESEDCERVLPDVITFGNGRSFNINHDVPINITNRLLSLAELDPYLEHTDMTDEIEVFAIESE